MSRIKWLKSRQKGIGGSDAAAVCGISKWRTPYDVYLSKTETIKTDIQNDAMRWGNLKEPLIRQEYCNITGNEVVEPKTFFQHAEYPWMIANLDGVILNPDDPESIIVFEAKTSRDDFDWGQEGTDQVPFSYILQVQHYMAVIGSNEAHIAALIGSSDFRIYYVDADEELQGQLIEIEMEFWKRVEERNPPELQTLGDAQKRFPKNLGDMKTVSDSSSASRLAKVKQDIKKLEKEAVELELILKKEIGEKDGLIDESGKVLATWKAGKPVCRLDSKRIQKDLPEICKPYLNESEPTRRFLLKVKE